MYISKLSGLRFSTSFAQPLNIVFALSDIMTLGLMKLYPAGMRDYKGPTGEVTCYYIIQEPYLLLQAFLDVLAVIRTWITGSRLEFRLHDAPVAMGCRGA